METSGKESVPFQCRQCFGHIRKKLRLLYNAGEEWQSKATDHSLCLFNNSWLIRWLWLRCTLKWNALSVIVRIWYCANYVWRREGNCVQLIVEILDIRYFLPMDPLLALMVSIFLWMSFTNISLRVIPLPNKGLHIWDLRKMLCQTVCAHFKKISTDEPMIKSMTKNMPRESLILYTWPQLRTNSYACDQKCLDIFDQPNTSRT